MPDGSPQQPSCHAVSMFDTKESHVPPLEPDSTIPLDTAAGVRGPRHANAVADDLRVARPEYEGGAAHDHDPQRYRRVVSEPRAPGRGEGADRADPGSRHDRRVLPEPAGAGDERFDSA